MTESPELSHTMTRTPTRLAPPMSVINSSLPKIGHFPSNIH